MYENGKMRPVETIPGMGGEWQREWIQLYLVRTLVNVTMYPPYNNNFKNEEKIKRKIFKCVYVYPTRYRE
jgi:hypothetical protein